MHLTGVHLLLTYECTRQCDHCFVWGSPRAGMTMTRQQVDSLIRMARDLGTVTMVYFEGGEPFLHPELMLEGAALARSLDLRWGAVTNAFWATSLAAALAALRPLAELGLSDLSLSTDAYHGASAFTPQILHAAEAASRLGIPVLILATEGPGSPRQCAAPGLLAKVAWGNVMYRGRAARLLAGQAGLVLAGSFGGCPHEQLDRPGRVHVDAHGYVHVCQGLAVGCVSARATLGDVLAAYQPADHPVVGPLLQGGPAGLARRYGLDIPLVADACHLCYLARDRLRQCFPEYLGPPGVYGDGQNHR